MDGIINVYKEKGFTSFDVVAKLRGILHQKKIGHTGTLDPDAEGVLPVCLGNATKVCELLTDKDKEYEAVLRLGITTDTQDLTGQVLQEKAVNVTEEQLRQVIAGFQGEIFQIPPMYSALKVNGKKLCDLARQGIEVERKPRKITIFSITIEQIAFPDVRIKVHCSKGTYIRTLCQDIGEQLGCGGCMAALVRNRVSQFSIENAQTLDQIEAVFKAGKIEELLLPVDLVFDSYPRGIIREAAVKRLENGNTLDPDDFDSITEANTEKSLLPFSGNTEMKLRVYNSNLEFYAIYEYKQDIEAFKIIKMFQKRE